MGSVTSSLRSLTLLRPSCSVVQRTNNIISFGYVMGLKPGVVEVKLDFNEVS